MPLLNPTDVSNNTISFNAWKNSVSNNRVRYYEYGTPTQYLASFGKLGIVLITKIIDSAEITDFETNYKPTGINADSEFEMVELSSMDATIGQLDGRQQKAYEFGTSTIYIGYAEFGVSQASSGWTIKKIELDGNGNPSSEKWTGVGVGTWNNRASETYL